MASLARCALAAMLIGHAGAAAAQAAYPAKAIRFVVPFPAGGPLDIVARAIGQELNKRWGQPVIIDNRPGAGGRPRAVSRVPACGMRTSASRDARHRIYRVRVPVQRNSFPRDTLRIGNPVLSKACVAARRVWLIEGSNFGLTHAHAAR